VSAAWVAAATRSRGLLHRRLGPDRTRQLETAPLADAVAILADSPYGRYVRRAMPLDEAERSVDATFLWHLRILAGWGPVLAATSLRLLAARFEIENIEDLFLRFGGAAVSPPFELGALALSWPRVASAASAADLRQRLVRSSWGDPGSEDLGMVRVGLRLAWASQIAGQLPVLRRLATSSAALAVGRANAGGVVLAGRPLGLARALLGPNLPAPGVPQRARTTGSIPDLLEGTGSDRLWAEEVGWWSLAESTGSKLAAASTPSESMVVGVVLLLAVDAWRVRGALQVAAGQDAPREVIDALA
jgi:hypothetical protein